MNLPQELYELQEKRVKLEDESLSLKEEQKNLEEKARELEQKIIEELNSKNEKRRQEISQLKSRVNDLEQKLGQITREPRGPEPTEKTASEQSNQAAEGVSAQINPEALDESADEGTVVVTDVADSSESDEEQSADKGSGRKKHKFF